MRSTHRSGRPPRLTRRNAIRESANVPRPAGLTRFSPPPDQTGAAGSIQADDSESEEGDESGATEEKVGEVEETGAGTALLAPTASSVVAVVKRRITNWTKLELVGAGSFGRVYKAVSEDGFIFAVKEASLIGPQSNAKQSASQLEQEETVLSIFLEFVSEGSLVSAYEKRQLEESTVSVSAFYQIRRGQLPPVPSSLSLVAREFIHKCLRVNPDGRPSADELLALPGSEQDVP
ncbi:hypothetical protein C2845_PM11G24570 [Panicum miliaceum]|uniref:mitogen-activated protein kinase kinase kinase n=1 Tax=Panicum miliaceum TaxID=4540 RepID=A0A3L6RQI2_PANMI|nr:hypothetical protein C2845_PM11G24570 [Panicum miliaceum]